MSLLSSPDMHDSALRSVCEKMAIAKGVLNSNQRADITAWSLEEYRLALQSLPPEAWEPNVWEAFLGSLSGLEFETSNLLFAIFPCDFSGTPWTPVQLQQGNHFQLVPVDTQGKLTLYGQGYVKILPQMLWSDGLISFEPGQNTTVLKSKLKEVFDKLKPTLFA